MPKVKKRAIFISFEGTEGSGKSTLIQVVSAELKKLGLPVVQTREPGGNPLSEKIRSILLENAMNPWTELFLYEAARVEHFLQTIQPALNQNAIVLCDRFTDSTLAYQAEARGLPWAKVHSLNRMATFGVQPDLTVFLDIDPALGLSRAKDPNRFEAEGVKFQKKVRSGFLKARARNSHRWFTLKTEEKSPEVLANALLKYLMKRFGNRLQENRRD